MFTVNIHIRIIYVMSFERLVITVMLCYIIIIIIIAAMLFSSLFILNLTFAAIIFVYL